MRAFFILVWAGPFVSLACSSAKEVPVPEAGGGDPAVLTASSGGTGTGGTPSTASERGGPHAASAGSLNGSGSSASVAQADGEPVAPPVESTAPPGSDSEPAAAATGDPAAAQGDPGTGPDPIGASAGQGSLSPGGGAAPSSPSSGGAETSSASSGPGGAPWVGDSTPPGGTEALPATGPAGGGTLTNPQTGGEASGSGGVPGSGFPVAPGGTVASSGTSGTGSPVATGGVVASGGAPNDSSAPPSGGSPSGDGPALQVSNTYATSGPWHGYLWPAVDWEGVATIDPSAAEGFRDPGPPFCVSGHVPATSNSTAVAMIGMNTNQDQGNGPVAAPWTPTGVGILVNVSNAGGSPLRLQIQTDETGAIGEEWCAMLTEFDQDVVVPWSDFYQHARCADRVGTPFDQTMAGIATVMVLVPGTSEAGGYDFEFCLNELTPV